MDIEKFIIEDVVINKDFAQLTLFKGTKPELKNGYEGEY
jgi:hypothetical protein